METVETC